MAKFAAIALIFASVVAVAVGQAFPDTIALCGQLGRGGECTVVDVLKNEGGFATGVGPVPADAVLGATGDFPEVFSLCGFGQCVVVPVVKEVEEPEAAEPGPGMSMSSTCPDSIGMCGEGSCKVVPVNKNEDGVAVSVGPVMAKGSLGTPGAYSSNVGVCCDGVCRALPVMVIDGGRKLF